MYIATYLLSVITCVESNTPVNISCYQQLYYVYFEPIAPLSCMYTIIFHIYRLAFATHISSIFLFMKNVTIGAWQLALTGSLMLLACLSYSTIIINDPTLQIHFPNETLIPTFKPAFWVNLGTGIATVLIASLILIAEKLIPLKVATFFNVQDNLFIEVI